VKQGRIICLVAISSTLLAGCLGKKNAAAPAVGTSAEPDKVLYEKANNDLKHGRYTTGRLALETLINTYPDSEYLAKAKLAIGDSYYKEGGTAGLKQSIVEYQDFRTFFPFLDESAYAQMQIAMAHYRQMEKPDRDHTEAVQAEAEFQTFLEKYPSSPLVPQAEQDLRNVQEVLAEGNFRVANFYYLRGAFRASGARLMELTDRYPLYSQADQANWMLGQIWEKPPADPTAVARMQKEQEAPRPGMIKRTMGVLKNNPDVSTAARSGPPTMTPASETGDETLGMALQPNTPSATTSTIGNNAAVETITPGSPNALPNPPAAPAADAAPAPSDSTPAATTDSSQPASGSSSTDSSNSQSTDSTNTTTPANSSQESSSKKKSGLRKLIPF
jgi:outer membrane protein assembly factor BamD